MITQSFFDFEIFKISTNIEKIRLGIDRCDPGRGLWSGTSGRVKRKKKYFSAVR